MAGDDKRFRIGLSGCSGALESVSTSELLDLAGFVEALGYDALWLNEEHFQGGAGGGADGRRCLSPLILASAMLARTSRLRIGFSVLLMAMHHPLRLAEDLASLDVLSDGRVDFGVSRGANPRYLSAFGISEELTSHESFVASLKLMKAAWSENAIEIGADQISFQPKPVQRPHPPVYVGTYTLETAVWAAGQGHRIICHGVNNLASIAPVMQSYVAAGGDASQVPFGRFVYVSDSDESAKAELWETVLKLTTRLKSIGLAKRNNVLAEEDLEPENFYAKMVIAGGPDTCARRILDLREQFGVGYLNALAAFFGYLPLELLKKSLTLLAREVRPQLG
jgi:alkanesulfonate monooxygenase SsuD/methylene tetrahydromethanopterin reductase-like flavin-dependent oxidoreductase (luciferase family)